MLIRSWGSRGSIPVSGRKYLKFGGDTACIEIRSKDDDIIIVDAGSGIRRLGKSLLKERKNNLNIIFTHAHWDHLMGFPFFIPIYIKKTRINMLGCPFAQSYIKTVIAPVMQPPYFPVKFDEISEKITFQNKCDSPFYINSIKVTPILLSHPNQGIGYKFEEGGKSFVYLTDNELTFKHPGGLEFNDYLEFSKGADLLIHDAEFTSRDYITKKTWGHSVYTDALNLALQAEVKSFGLYHHNQERSDTGVDGLVADCRKRIKSACRKLRCFGVTSNMQIKL